MIASVDSEDRRSDWQKERQLEYAAEAAKLPERKGDFIVVRTYFNGILDWEWDDKKSNFKATWNKNWSKYDILYRTRCPKVTTEVFTSYRAAVARAIYEREHGTGSEWFGGGYGQWKTGPPYDSRSIINTENDTGYMIEVTTQKKFDEGELKRGEKLEELQRKREVAFEKKMKSSKRRRSDAFDS